jgi:hypothetical protein
MNTNDIKIIIADAHDADGIGSAIIAKMAFPEAEVRLTFYGPELKALEPEPGMLFVDMTPPEDKVDRFVEAGAYVVDHHEKQKWIVDKFGDHGVYSDEPGVSAALLTLLEVFMPKALSDKEQEGTTWTVAQIERLTTYVAFIGVRDTWQKEDPFWRDACILTAAIEFYGFDHWEQALSNGILPTPNTDELNVGEILYERRLKLIQKVADSVIVRTAPNGKRYGIVPLQSKIVSDLAEYMRQERDLRTLVGFWYEARDGDLSLHVSMRSDEVDVGSLAVRAGGGGHRNAAGFEKHREEGMLNPLEWLTRFFEEEVEDEDPREG